MQVQRMQVNTINTIINMNTMLTKFSAILIIVSKLSTISAQWSYITTKKKKKEK